MNHLFYFKILLFCFLIGSIVDASGQVLGQTVRNPHFVDMNNSPRGILNQLLPPAPAIEGSNYFEQEWHTGKVLLKSGSTLVNFSIRYDIGNSIIEIKSRENELIKVCPVNLLESFSWYDLNKSDSLKFSNCDNYVVDGFQSYLGAFEILVEGELTLLAKIEVEIQDGNYLAALDMGDRDRQIVKKEEFYISRDRKARVLKPKLKDNLDHFEPYGNEITAFAKKEKLKCRKKEDLIRMVDHYNKLASGH